MTIRILIDDPTIRLLLRRLLEKQPGWQVCGEASNGIEAIEGVERFAPDIVVMDLAMPIMNGLQAAPEIVKTHPKLPMLLISVQEVSKQLAWEARNAGYPRCCDQERRGRSSEGNRGVAPPRYVLLLGSTDLPRQAES